MDNATKAEQKRVRTDVAVQKKNLKLTFWAVAGVILLGLGVYGVISLNAWRSSNLPGQLLPDLGREHVSPGHVHTYNSNPPTSGWHLGSPQEWGVYNEEKPDESLIHNLEHGGVWISYRPGISEEIKEKLAGFYKKYGRKIIVTPRSRNDSDIALVAWTRLDKFSVGEYSDERIERFVKAFRNKGPEFVP